MDDKLPIDVNVWLVMIPGSAGDTSVLDPSELAQGARYHHERDRVRFLGRRIARRTVLGTVLGCDAAALRFRAGPGGKPSLEWPQDSGVEFNCSSSGNLAAIATTRGGEVGIDVEAHRVPADEVMGVTAAFAPEERAALGAMEAEARRKAFHDCWARKEAFLKGIGDGLMRPLEGFAVTAEPGTAARLLRVDWDPGATARWRLAALALGEGWSGAIAADRPAVIRRAVPPMPEWRPQA